MLAPVPAAPRQVETWEEALVLVRERSTDLETAQANIDRAEGRWRQALSALLPNARFSANVSYDVLQPRPAVLPGGAGVLPDGTVPLGIGTASLTQSVVDLSAWRGLSSAEAAQRSAEASLQDVRRRLTLGLARTLVAVVAAERAAELNRVGLRQALERAALVQRTLELGAATQLDVARTRQDVEVARQSLIAGDEQLRRAREALGLALGFDQGVGVSQRFQLQGLVDRGAEQLRSAAGRQRAAGPGGRARAGGLCPGEPAPGVRGLPAHAGRRQQPVRLHHAIPGSGPCGDLEHLRRAVRAHLGRRPARRPGARARGRRAASRASAGAHPPRRRAGGGSRPAWRRGGRVAGEDDGGGAARWPSRPTSSPAARSRLAAAAAWSWCRARRPCARRSLRLALREFELVQARLEGILDGGPVRLVRRVRPLEALVTGDAGHRGLAAWRLRG